MQAQMMRPPAVATRQQLSVRQCTQVMDGVLSMAISNVCFARGLFPPEDFDAKPMEADLPVQRRLKENERTAGLWRWLREGVSPALEKRYLDKVRTKAARALAPPTPNNAAVLEVLSF
jgi:hypothetical protein